MRKTYSGKFKAKIAVEVIREQDTLAEISSKFEVHRVLLTRWKKEAINGLPEIFSKKSNKNNNDNQLIDNLYKQIGQLKVENDWLKKRLRQSITDRKELIDWGYSQISINRQCDLLKVSKGTLYYKPKPIDPYTLILMDLIDKQHTKTPFYGSRRLTAYLRNGKGHDVNRKRVQRLMRLMRIEAIYPKPKTTNRDKEHKIYPYLLRDVEVVRADQVWSTDITYIRVGKGFAYLTAIIDWYSRYVLSWKLSNTLENTFCIEALEEALGYSKPEIFNTDQGSQYTASNLGAALLHRKYSANPFFQKTLKKFGTRLN